MKKPKLKAAKIAAKRGAKRVRRKEAQADSLGAITLNLDAIDDLIAEWLAGKPEEERAKLLEGRDRLELLDLMALEAPPEHPCQCPECRTREEAAA